MAYDLIIRSRLPTNYGLKEVSVGIEGDTIAAIAATENWSGPRIDAPETILLPGAIDPHAHVVDNNVLPGRTYEEGARLALLGGVTTVLEFPTDAPLLSPSAYRERIGLMKGHGVDFGLHVGNITPEAFESLPELEALGASWCKGFLSPPYALGDEELDGFFAAVNAAGMGALLHAEDGRLVEHYELIARGQNGAFPSARPPLAEGVGIARAVRAAVLAGTALHVVHCTTGVGSAVVRYAQEYGGNVTTEACLHHLTFSIKSMERLGCRLKMNPPLRAVREQEALWAAMRSGEVAMLGTDHFYTPGRAIDGDIWSSPAGVPGLDAVLPVFHTLARERGWEYTELVRAVAGAAAVRFGLADRGVVRGGMRADLVLMDPRKYAIFKSTLDWSPYEGMELHGTITHVVKNGQVAVENGEVVRQDGGGHIATAIGTL